MTTYVFRDGQLIEKSLASPQHAVGGAPNIISDEMPLTRHMVDNKYYSSKAKFREVTRAAGCVEVGNDPALTRPRTPVPLDRAKRRDDIRKTIYELRNGRRG